jgi:hypothetical protein
MLLIHHETIWRPWQESHLRPPASPTGALCAELQGQNGDHTRIQTWDLCLRRAALWFAELCGHGWRPAPPPPLDAAPLHAGTGLPASWPLSELARAAGLEPAISRFATWCFVHLSYARTLDFKVFRPTNAVYLIISCWFETKPALTWANSIYRHQIDFA